MTIWDISVPIVPGMPTWPGDPTLVLERYQTISPDKGNSANVSRIEAGVHLGTHVDAPLHFLEHGSAVDMLPLDILVGSTLVVEIPNVAAIEPQHLETCAIPVDTTRLLLKTSNSRLWRNPQHTFTPDFTAITSDAAAWLVARGVRLIGIDYLSIQLFHDETPLTHHRLLEAGIVIVEGLNLDAIEPGAYHLVCLPLKFVGCDGAPARAILMREP